MDSVRARLQHWKQNDILEYIDRKPEAGKNILAQFEAMGVDRVFEDFQRTMQKYRALKAQEGSKEAACNKEFFPPKFIKTSEFKANNTEELKKELTSLDSAETPAMLIRKNEIPEKLTEMFTQEGIRIMKEGQLACVLLAGGQGSRLKFEGPKGCYRLDGLPGKPALFQILLERVVALKKLTGAKSIPLYIMVSIQNGAATRQFIEEMNYFGLPKEDVMFFEQTVMPSFSETGHALLEGPDSLTRNSNGNGGLFESLKLTGQVQDMKKRNIKFVHVFGVDNVLVKMGDPLFIGMCALAGVPVGNKCVSKAYPAEKVGVQSYSQETTPDGKVVRKPCVVEYTEISNEQSLMRVNPDDPNSDLLFSAGNICNHFFTMGHIDNVLTNPEFEYHVAVKNLKVYDCRGECPTTVTGIKLEYFIFDSFLPARCVLALEASRDEEFSPVKNFEGIDSPASAVKDLLQMHAKWLKAAGIELDAPKCQIGWPATYQGEGLEQFKGKKASQLSPTVVTE